MEATPQNLEALERLIAAMNNRIDLLEGMIGKGQYSNLVVYNSPVQVDGGISNKNVGTLIDSAGKFLIADLAAGSTPSIQGWTSSLVLSATDYRTVAWAAGTITLADGTAYSIDAGNTGNMTAGQVYYIYLDVATSTTALQKSTTAADSVGADKILVAVAAPNTDTDSKATFQAFGGRGGALLGVDNIAANSASTNELISNTAQIKDAIITNAKIVSLDVGKLTAGSIISKAITLSFTEGAGDCYIAAGKTDFDHDESGFIMGIDDSDSNKVKFIIGNSTEYLAVLGDTFVNTLRIGGYTAGNVELLASNAVHSEAVVTSAKILKEFRAGRDGTYRFTYDHRIVTSGAGSCRFRLQLHYSYWGADYIQESQQSVGGAGDSGWYSMPASGVIDVTMSAGWNIFLIAYGQDTVTAYARNFKMKVSALNEITAPSVIVA